MKKSRLNRSETIELFRNAFFFHIYLLLLTHSEEITIGFTLIPAQLPPVPLITIYEQAYIQVGFIVYYIFAFHHLINGLITRHSPYNIIFPVSALVPYFFLTSPIIHLVYSGIALLIYFIWHSLNHEKLSFYSNSFFQNTWFAPGIIFLLALFFRLWYAKYFASFGDVSVGFAADGPAYFKSALAFSKANISEVDFRHAPFYSFYLAGFLVLFGHSPAVIFYSQAIVGSLTPVLIFLITRVLFDKKTGVIAGLLVATSHLCIHYSVVVNRSAPLLVTIPLIIYICLNLREDKQRLKLWSLGLFFGFSFYFGQETLLSLIMFFIYSIILFIKMASSKNQVIKKISWVILGILIAFIPLNWLYHNHSGGLVLLGRTTYGFGGGAKLMSYSGNRFAQKMLEMEFNPIGDPGNSLLVFLNHPLGVTKVLFGKLFTEMPGFLFDPGGEFMMPLSFSIETFYGAHFQFYIYLFVFVGLFIFIFQNKITLLNKMLIVGPIALQLLFSSVLMFGTFRFRVPITPLNMILAALAVKVFFFYPKSQSSLSENFSALPAMPLIQNIHAAWNRWRKILLAGGLILLIFLTIVVKKSYYYNPINSGHDLTPWIIINEHQQQININTNKVGLNSTVFAYYKLNKESPPSDLIISFNMCRYLMPGMKLYYRVAVDGKFIGAPEKIPGGCSTVREKFQTTYLKGVASLFVYASHDGKTATPEPYLLNLIENQKIKIPIINFILDKELRKYTELFQTYSYGYVKISNLKFLSGSQNN